MRGSSTEFFADRDDLAFLFTLYEQLKQFEFTKVSSTVNHSNIKLAEATQLLDYLVTSDKPTQTNVFLCTKIGTPIVTSQLEMSDGSGIKNIADHFFNDDSAEILLGGQVNPDLIVQTTISTNGETAQAKEIFKILKKTLLKNAKKVRTFYVMAGAYDKLVQGVRLAQGAGFNPDYDLRLD